MPTDEKGRPAIPLAPRPLREILELSTKDAAIRGATRIKMTVRGGVTSQAYSLDFLATGDGTAECRFECRLSGRKGESGKGRLSEHEIVSLLGSMLGAMRLPEQPPRFLPDTLIGILEVWHEDRVWRYYFAADPEQAKTQRMIPPQELLQAVNSVYSACAKLTGARSVKP
jgi:hypothetical protein